MLVFIVRHDLTAAPDYQQSLYLLNKFSRIPLMNFVTFNKQTEVVLCGGSASWQPKRAGGAIQQNTVWKCLLIEAEWSIYAPVKYATIVSYNYLSLVQLQTIIQTNKAISLVEP